MQGIPPLGFPGWRCRVERHDETYFALPCFSPEDTVSILVAGLGSECGADAFGWEVLRELESCGLPKTVNLMLCRHPGELMMPLLGADSAIIIDACVGGEKSGMLRRLRLEDIEGGERQLHGFGLVEVLRLVMALGVSPARLQILGLTVATPTTGLDPEWVSDGVRELVQILSEPLSAAAISSAPGG